MFNKPIKKSLRFQHYQVGVVLGIAIALVLLTFALLADGREYLGVDGTALGWITRIVILLVAAGAVFAAYSNGRGRAYEFKNNTLVITDNGFGVTEHTKIISLTPQSISSISVEQSMLKKMIDVGTVVISVDGVSSPATYRIEDIDYPDEFLAELNKYLHSAPVK
ncbi:TPA: hypothetical protein DD425_03600 [Candidatus Saccharibacteria bacterium]|nr:hypothetical protein [Candidatus Saccharibacteria bacterium]|tara:strand:+ start:316 stop:810 length:495 start_codon:yes stop_codon:yes gene_type:complete